MSLATHLYRQALGREGGWKPRLFGRLRRLLLRWSDPVCEMNVYGRRLAMPLSHPLPRHRVRHPCYDALPERLAAFLRERDGSVKAIDVGANIGDTLAALHLTPDDTVLAIEPVPGFVRLLRENWGDDRRVTMAEAICSAEPNQAGLTIEASDGTGRVRASDAPDSETLAVKSLDGILEEHPEFAGSNLLKIDTDGHDFEVLRGCPDLIHRSKPVVFFECDGFGNPDYLDDCRKALAEFRAAGYAGMLVYDNFGYLMGRYSLDQPEGFEQLLVYQLISEFYYFDLLLIEPAGDLDAFHESELRFFTERIDEPALGELPRHHSEALDTRPGIRDGVELAG